MKKFHPVLVALTIIGSTVIAAASRAEAQAPGYQGPYAARPYHAQSARPYHHRYARPHYYGYARRPVGPQYGPYAPSKY